MAKVAFLGERERERLGEIWEVLAVITCLAIVEKTRGRKNKNSSAAAAGGAAGGAA